MSAREVIAYAITHAPRGQRGGPYEGRGMVGAQVPALRDALRWRSAPLPEMRAVRKVQPHARVIRIVRARPSSGQEASAVEVLRELAELHDAWLLSPGDLDAIMVRARRVLAASGPDPIPVVRAALRFAEHCTPALEGSAWFEATREFIDAVDAYRKAGGTP